VISPPQGRYLHTGQHKQRINAHTDISGFSGIRTHDPRARTSEDSASDRGATVIGPTTLYGIILYNVASYSDTNLSRMLHKDYDRKC
jgi:hypothetical protein